MSKQNNDIEKYLRGELSPKEMHQLEMKALNDPFLAEALEGADSIESNDFTNDVASINRKIKTKTAKKYYWPLRIAASLLLLVAVTYLVIRNSPESDLLALEKSSQTRGDSIVNEQETKSEQQLSPDTVTKESKLNEETLLSLKTEDKPKANTAVKPDEIKNQSQPQETDKIPKPTLVIEADVITEDKEVVAEKTSETELAHVNEAEKIKGQRIETRRAKSETLKKSSPSSLSGASSDSAIPVDHSTTTAKPSIDYEEYLKYLKANVKYPKAAADNNIIGEVIVSFLVNSDSTLSDFKIDKSIGFGCDEELIRVIQSGPVWTPGLIEGRPTQERASVSFIFNRLN